MISHYLVGEQKNLAWQVMKVRLVYSLNVFQLSSDVLPPYPTVNLNTFRAGVEADATDAAALGPAPQGAPRLWGPRAMVFG